MHTCMQRSRCTHRGVGCNIERLGAHTSLERLGAHLERLGTHILDVLGAHLERLGAHTSLDVLGAHLERLGTHILGDVGCTLGEVGWTHTLEELGAHMHAEVGCTSTSRRLVQFGEIGCAHGDAGLRRFRTHRKTGVTAQPPVHCHVRGLMHKESRFCRI